MDEVLFRSSQKIENLQVQAQLAAFKSKDLILRYSQQSKSLILQAWNSAGVEHLRNNVSELIVYLASLRDRMLFVVDPRKIYNNVLGIFGKRWTKRDMCFGCAGFLLGSLIGVVIGLSLRKKKESFSYMEAVQCSNYLGIESVAVVQDAISPGECKEFEVLVNVKAASVHIIDTQICTGYGKNLRRILCRLNKQSNSYLPVILGRDCTGIVTDLGHRVKRLEVGDEVWLTVPFWAQGTLCQVVSVHENRVSRKPKTVGFEGACSLPYAGSLALSALQEAEIDIHNAQSKKILVQGGCTPVGCVLIQILKYWKADVTATCYKRAIPVAKALGVEDTIVLREHTNDNKSSLELEETETTTNALLKELEIRGPVFDVIINAKDCNISSDKLHTFCNERGIVISTLPPELLTDSCGFMSSMCVEVYMRVRFMLQRLIGLPLPDFDEAHLCYVSLDKLAELVEDGYLQTVVDKVFHPEDIELALNHISSTQSIGSTIITFR